MTCTSISIIKLMLVLNKSCQAIVNLILSNNQITQINGTQKLGKLKQLYLDNNQIEKIENLSFNEQIVTLDLSFNKIKKIEVLDSLQICLLYFRRRGPHLIYFVFIFSIYSNKKGLTKLKKLEELNLSNNQIRSLVDLDKCLKLNEIQLDNNLIESGKGFRGLKSINVCLFKGREKGNRSRRTLEEYLFFFQPFF